MAKQMMRKTILIKFLFILISFKLLFSPLMAEVLEEGIYDDTQDAISLAEKDKGQWVPVPIPVANPTVGNGLQAVLMYLHPKKTDTKHNTTSGIAGLYTDTESWFVGAFHDDYLAGDKYRYSIFMGTGEFNLDYYGIGNGLGDRSVSYQFNMQVFAPKFQFRIANLKNWFTGVHYIYLDSDSIFRLSELDPNLSDLEISVKTAGLGLLLTYDSRDDNYYPTSGQWFETKLTDYRDTWGGKDSYQKTTTFINHYQPVTNDLVIALRANLQTSDGDTPFFDLPTLKMRGFSSDRYRDQHTISLHSEARYKFLPRWGVTGFYEVGWFNNNSSDLFDDDMIKSIGAGLRWQVTKEQGMNLGVDVAYSSGDYTVYVQVGEGF